MKKVNFILSVVFLFFVSNIAIAYTVEMDPLTPLTDYIGLGEWNTDGDFQNWTTHQFADEAVAGGNIEGLDIGNDPNISLNITALASPDFRIGHSTIAGTIFEIRMQLATNSANQRTEFFPTIDTTFLTPPLRFAYNTTPELPDIPLDGAFHVFRMTLGEEDSNYLGSLDSIRFDILADWGASGEFFKVDYFRAAKVITTIKVDTAPLFSYVSLAEWNTDDDFEDWIFASVTSSNVLDGIMSGVAANNDPYFSKTGVPSVDLDANKIIEFRLKLDATVSSGIQIYFNAPSAERVVSIPANAIPADGNFHIYQYNMESHSLWTGLLSGFRLDPYVVMAAAGKTFEIDYIRIGNPEIPVINPSASQAVYSDKIVVTWDEINNVTNYQVWRNTTDDSSTATINSPILTANIFEDTTAIQNTFYYYWVKAWTTNVWSEFGNSALGFTKSVPPETPTNLSPIDFNVVTSPVALTASVFSDPGGFDFAVSEWQFSDQSDFSHIIWRSGENIPRNYLTAPASAEITGTNFWRVRYKNERETWSLWSAHTSFILVKPTITSDKFFDDCFNCPGSGDVNNQYDAPGRQTGISAPLTYKILSTTEAGNSSSNPGQLTIGQNSGCSINKSFEDAINFKIGFDVEPHEFDGTTDGFALCFGKSTQNSFAHDSESGAGLAFLANGEFHSYDGEIPLSGGSIIPTDKKAEVSVCVSADDFDYGTVIYTVFANGVPMIQNANYGYKDDGGYGNNYITLFSSNSVSANPTVVDNISIEETSCKIMATNWTSDADSFVDSSKIYTHAVNLNGSDLDINTVTFHGTLGGSFGGTNFQNGSEYCISNGAWEIMSSGGNVNFVNGGSSVPADGISGDSKTLAEDFCWWGSTMVNGNSFAIKLSGLAPFSSNIMTIYTYAYENADRKSYFLSSAGGMTTNVNQDTFGTGNGLILRYSYVALADGTFTLVSLPPVNASFHISAFSNEETAQAEPELDVNKYIYFGEVLVGNSKNMSLEIKNIGGGNVDGSISGASAEFSLTNSYFATALIPNIINVEFTPTSEENYTNVIALSGTGGNAEVTLIGSGVPEGGIVFSILFSVFSLFLARRKNYGVQE